jgi:Arc/MetJ family transcription regulator
MRTNIVLDDDLVQEAMGLSGIRTKKELVHEALRSFIASKKRKSLLDLAGKIEFAPGYDYKEARAAGSSSFGSEPRPAGSTRSHRRPRRP